MLITRVYKHFIFYYCIAGRAGFMQAPAAIRDHVACQFHTKCTLFGLDIMSQ